MQIGKLKQENSEFLDGFKDHGFSNRTKMLDSALDLLRDVVKKEKRQKARQEMLEQYVASDRQNYFESIDGDDFE